jgi:hypothetical protein
VPYTESCSRPRRSGRSSERGNATGAGRGPPPSASLTRIQGSSLSFRSAGRRSALARVRPRPPSPGASSRRSARWSSPAWRVARRGFVAFPRFQRRSGRRRSTPRTPGAARTHPPWTSLAAAWHGRSTTRPARALQPRDAGPVPRALVVGIRRLPLYHPWPRPRSHRRPASSDTAHVDRPAVAVALPARRPRQVRSPAQLAWVIASTMFPAVLFLTFIHGDWVAWDGTADGHPP